MADIRIHKRFTDVVLDDPNQGRQRYWRDVMSQLQEQPFAVLKIGVPMPGMGAAYFCVKNGIVNICLSKDAATFEDNKIKFKEDRDFAIFVHEAAHFQHIVVDNGVWRSPSLANDVPLTEDRVKEVFGWKTEAARLRSLEIRNTEYEAGWRAMFNDKVYKLFPGSRVLLETMIANLLMYDISRQPKEWRDKLGELAKTDEEANAYVKQHCLSAYKKYSEWADPHHLIKGVL